MLFTYLRAIPQRIGYREEVWLQDWGPIGRLIAKPQFATISVRQKTRIRDLETYYVTVDRDDGRRSEFWVSSQGLRPVALATLADRSQWACGRSRGVRPRHGESSIPPPLRRTP
jgi:hypothetical protein